MERSRRERDVAYYVRRAFGPCLIVAATLFLVRLWLDGWWPEWQVNGALKRAAAQQSVESQNDTLAHIIRILDGYKRHIAASTVLCPGLSTEAVDKAREDLDWYQIQTAHVYQESLDYDQWKDILEDFLAKYELPDLRAIRPEKRRTLTIVLWVFGIATVVTFFAKLSWHEWGEM